MNPDRQQLFAESAGLNESTSFEQALATKVQHEFKEVEREYIEQQLSTHELSFPAHSWPTTLYTTIKHFTDQDWKFIQTSPNQLISLYALDHFHRVKEWESQFFSTNIQEQAMIRSFPLIHGMSFAQLLDISESGVFKTNREMYKATGSDAEAFIGQFRNTHSEDRELGLDQYIFTHFARPDAAYDVQDVTVVLDPSLLGQPGVFATEKDYLDYFDQNNSIDAYTESISQPPYFYDQAIAKIHSTRVGEARGGVARMNTIHDFMAGTDSENNNMGRTLFSTWEVKLPAASFTDIKKVVFKDQKQYEEFKTKFGDTIACVYEPQLTKEKYTEAFRIDGEYAKQFTALTENDYDERMRALDALSDKEKGKKVVVFKKIDGGALLTERSNPFSIPGTVYSSISEAGATIKTHNPDTSRYAGLAIPGQITSIDESTLLYVAEIETTKTGNPSSPSRILSLRQMTPLEMRG